MERSRHAEDSLFPKTDWQRISDLVAGGNTTRIVGELFEKYGNPLHTLARSRGWDHAAAEDLVMGFFAEKVIARRFFQGADPNSGRLRTYLTTGFIRYCDSKWREGQALKRGGGILCLSLDGAREGEEGALPAIEVPDGALRPDELADLAWAISLYRDALADLGREQAHGRGDSAKSFPHLKIFLSPFEISEEVCYSEVARRTGITESNLRQIVKRLRAALHLHLERRVVATLGVQNPDPGLLEDEMRHLGECIRRFLRTQRDRSH